jgi:L-threonylcarbamoyladenylate synthase
MQNLSLAVAALKQGKLIAYPTEAVFGLGCDPLQSSAVQALLTLKKRNPNKGLILIADNFEALLPYIDLSSIPKSNLDEIISNWPGPYTWVFPVNPHVSNILTGMFTSLAVRVTAHPIASALCAQFGGPIVSTSANPEGMTPAKTAAEVNAYFPVSLVIVEGALGDLAQPTQIKDAITLNVIRS